MIMIHPCPHGTKVNLVFLGIHSTRRQPHATVLIYEVRDGDV